MQFENRTCILEEGSIEDLIKALTKEVDKTSMPVNLRIFRRTNGKWGINRTCIIKEGTIDDVIKALEKELDCANMPVTFRIYQHKHGEWGICHESCWKPYRNLSCVDKVEGMLRRTKSFMNESNGKMLFLQVEGHVGIRGLNYYLELA